MRINSINTYKPAFNGKVYINYNRTAKNISNCPFSTQESIIGNINSLKQRLETQTPDYKTYVVKFDYDSKNESKFLPTYHSATISVSDEKGNEATQHFELGKTGGSRKDDRTQLASGEDIWQNGFKEITRQSINGLPKSEKDEVSIEMQKRGWEREDIRAEIQSIYDRIENRAKVSMNRAEIAASIWQVTTGEGCPDEIRESIIGNINTLTRRVEEESAKEKAYYLTVSNNYYLHEYNNGNHNDSLNIELSTNAGSYQQKYLTIRKYDARSNWEYYCVTDSERIYSEIFRPITEKTLWDAHNYLPFDNAYDKRQIVNQLA